MRQGTIGNCWFIAAAAALAVEPERLEKVFHHEEKYDVNGISINGIYAFNFWALMFPITITIDDRVPNKKDKKGSVMFAKIGRDGAVWGPLLEKALAKYHGTYEPLWAGNP